MARLIFCIVAALVIFFWVLPVVLSVAGEVLHWTALGILIGGPTLWLVLLVAVIGVWAHVLD